MAPSDFDFGLSDREEDSSSGFLFGFGFGGPLGPGPDENEGFLFGFDDVLESDDVFAAAMHEDPAAVRTGERRTGVWPSFEEEEPPPRRDGGFLSVSLARKQQPGNRQFDPDVAEAAGRHGADPHEPTLDEITAIILIVGPDLRRSTAVAIARLVKRHLADGLSPLEARIAALEELLDDPDAPVTAPEVEPLRVALERQYGRLARPTYESGRRQAIADVEEDAEEVVAVEIRQWQLRLGRNPREHVVRELVKRYRELLAAGIDPVRAEKQALFELLGSFDLNEQERQAFWDRYHLLENRLAGRERRTTADSMTPEEYEKRRARQRVETKERQKLERRKQLVSDEMRRSCKDFKTVRHALEVGSGDLRVSTFHRFLTASVQCPNSPDPDRPVSPAEARCVRSDLERYRQGLVNHLRDLAERYYRMALEKHHALEEKSLLEQQIESWVLRQRQISGEVNQLRNRLGRRARSDELERQGIALTPKIAEAKARVETLAAQIRHFRLTWDEAEETGNEIFDELDRLDGPDSFVTPESVERNLNSYLRDPRGFRDQVCHVLLALFLRKSQQRAVSWGARIKELQDVLDRGVPEPRRDTVFEWIRTAVGFVPIVGQFKDLYEASLGVTMFGDPISKEEQKALWVGLAIDLATLGVGASAGRFARFTRELAKRREIVARARRAEQQRKNFTRSIKPSGRVDDVRPGARGAQDLARRRRKRSRLLPVGLPQGGSYRALRKEYAGRGHEYHIHHMPADAASDLARGDGPAIAMRVADHKNTRSFDNLAGAKEYRAQQARLMSEGRFREAIEMDIADIRSKFGTDYDDAIAEMIEYAKSIGIW